MILKQIKVEINSLRSTTNCYLIIDEITKLAMVVDPGAQPERILEILRYNDAKLDLIVITHAHGDHIGSIVELKEQTGAKVCIHKLDADGLKDENKSLCAYVGVPNPNIDPDIYLEENDIINVGSLNFKVIHTPGHTNGSMCIYGHGALISGDTLFMGTWGRTDLPSSCFEDIISSIEKKLMILPDDTVVYPGHGRTTIIRDEKSIYLHLKM